MEKRLAKRLGGIALSSGSGILWIILLFAVVVVLYVCYPQLSDRYVFNEDMRWVMSWVYRFHDNPGFKNDFIGSYTYWLAPKGIKALYFLSSSIMDPVLVAKIIPVIMFLISVVYFVKLGSCIGGNSAAFFAGFIFVLMAWARKYSGIEMFGPGNGGDFYVPLAAMFLYYHIRRYYFISIGILLLQVLFYPPLFIISSLTLFFSCISNKNNASAFFAVCKRKPFYMAVIFTTCLFVFLGYAQNSPFGPTYTREEMLRMAEFYEGGRIEMFSPSFLKQITMDTTGIALDCSMVFLLLLFLCLACSIHRRILQLPSQLWYFLFSACILFFMAHVLLLKIHLPAKYIGIPTNIFLIYGVSFSISELMRILNNRFIKITLAFILIGIIAGFYVFTGITREDINLPASERALVSFLSKLPKESMLAGHPTTMDNVTVFTKRKIFLSEELSMPFHKGYYRHIQNRTYDFFYAYYSGSEEEIMRFCKKYKITHLVVDTRHFSEAYLRQKKFYLSPFNDYITGLARNKDFFLIRVPAEKKIFEREGLFVISCL